MPHRYRVHEPELAIARLEPDAAIPSWASGGSFTSVTRTSRELSIVCDAPRVPEDVLHERGWVMIELEGPFPFELTGVLAAFIDPLAAANVAIFAISTYNTDVVLVKRDTLEAALAALANTGRVRIL
ncbi:MAG: ACT domain-containing protein [Thermoanaerobaculia bacterium]